MEALVFAGGDPPDARWTEVLPRDALVVAADSGLEHVDALGLHADLVVGDLDSVSAGTLARAESAGTVVERHPADKDATDLELALTAALRQGATRVTLLGVGGGRLDHFLGNALLLAAPAWSTLELHALVGPAHVVVVRDRIELRGPVGSLVSLLPLGGPARGVRTTGLRWPLTGEELGAGSTRGVSNEMTETIATVALADGVLLAVQPDADHRHLHPDPLDPDSRGD
jgi:thiamine pyrophosphokinase